jgi:hypothetical protein
MKLLWLLRVLLLAGQDVSNAAYNAFRFAP